ncbi:uncharacterized protein LOC133800509 [Humulus lupulus]|uniref:uncharacterized protein LOC133800509 n=1 Tax=Humulus lupulus TaxID=3486 RepID=UPI002B418293|nr:uncharacterized protein LOC133800509 [Humulus lupulus]
MMINIRYSWLNHKTSFNDGNGVVAATLENLDKEIIGSLLPTRPSYVRCVLECKAVAVRNVESFQASTQNSSASPSPAPAEKAYYCLIEKTEIHADDDDEYDDDEGRMDIIFDMFLKEALCLKSSCTYPALSLSEFLINNELQVIQNGVEESKKQVDDLKYKVDAVMIQFLSEKPEEEQEEQKLQQYQPALQDWTKLAIAEYMYSFSASS